MQIPWQKYKIPLIVTLVLVALITWVLYARRQAAREEAPMMGGSPGIRAEATRAVQSILSRARPASGIAPQSSNKLQTAQAAPRSILSRNKRRPNTSEGALV